MLVWQGTWRLSLLSTQQVSHSLSQSVIQTQSLRVGVEVGLAAELGLVVYPSSRYSVLLWVVVCKNLSWSGWKVADKQWGWHEREEQRMGGWFLLVSVLIYIIKFRASEMHSDWNSEGLRRRQAMTKNGSEDVNARMCVWVGVRMDVSCLLNGRSLSAILWQTYLRPRLPTSGKL